MKYILPLLALTALPLSAQTVSPAAAETLARQFFTAHTVGPNRAPAKVDPVLSYTASTAGTPDFYVFNRAADAPGFVIVNAAATAEATPILGYSETSTFDYDTAPDNFRWWLEQYQQNGVAKAPAQTPAGRHDVQPLLKTTWDQTTPYNDEVISAQGGSYYFVTGCTATAMAQVMKYYEWPKQGKGSVEYVNEYLGGLKLTVSADFNTTYDWANMLDSYTPGNYNAQQAAAVARIMYHAGAAEKTYYGSSSSADDRHSGTALIEHFRYDKSMKRAEHTYYTDEEWDEILYHEMAANRPVLYSGQSGEDPETSVGHSFVCNGYEASTGKYYMNWGWSGNYDGYFALTGSDALKPNGTGTGGAGESDSYSYSQSIDYNIKPDAGGEPLLQWAVNGTYNLLQLSGNTLYAYSQLPVDCSTADSQLSLQFAPYNTGFFASKVLTGVLLRDVDTHAEYVIPGDVYSLNSSGYSLSPIRIYFPASSLPADGTFEVYPAVRDYYDPNGEWNVMLYKPSQTVPKLVVTGSSSPLSAAPAAPDIVSVSPIGDDGLVTDDSQLSVSVTVQNNSGSDISPYYVYYIVYTDNGHYGKGVGMSNISHGSQQDLTLDFAEYEGTPFTFGETYTVKFYKDANLLYPMNVPSTDFVYAVPSQGDESLTAAHLTQTIRNTKAGHGSISVIQALVNKVLKK